MKKAPTSPKPGYARKQQSAKALNKSFLLEDNRPCIKVYNEEDLPVKRQHKEEAQQKKIETVLPSNIEKFYQYVDKLDLLFKHTEKTEENPLETQSSSPQPIKEPEISNEIETKESVSDVLLNFVNELDKATKLTPSQIKIVQKYGVPFEVDPWKYEPRILKKCDKTERNERFDRNDRNFDRKYEHHRYRNYQKFNKKPVSVNVEDLISEIPENRRPEFFDHKYSLKKINVGFSIKKTLINERNSQILINS